MKCKSKYCHLPEVTIKLQTLSFQCSVFKIYWWVKLFIYWRYLWYPSVYGRLPKYWLPLNPMTKVLYLPPHRGIMITNHLKWILCPSQDTKPWHLWECWIKFLSKHITSMEMMHFFSGSLFFGWCQSWSLVITCRLRCQT